ncbi:membrane protein insertase YidC [Novosphingobium sp. G106]|uniref:membrane protein insertase YidC n=1 Tax=Novosphingobium sp. G106 TaxID=2849500 RepID=UPI001C2DEBE9|nr:membrane protein insertase YidC [Novosphingobium sp. G106]MBV1690875.1 membrane protein insertase YidC [Novosphingobium sp. G106]
MDNQRNIILAVVLTALILFGWDAGVRYMYPNAGKQRPAATAPASPEPTSAAKPTREGGLTSAADIAVEAQDLKAGLAAPGRIPVEAPGLIGSINPIGAVIDDLSIRRHTESIDKNSGPKRIFSLANTPEEHFAQFGWVDPTKSGMATPDVANMPVFSAPAGAKLTPATPVTLSWSNTTGQTFSITYAIDKDYLITATQTVTNRGSAPVTVQPYAALRRTDKTASLDTWNVHSGPIGAFDQSVSFAVNYKDVPLGSPVANTGKTDWLGFTDIYWLSALVPDGSPTSSDFRSLGEHIYRADLIYKDAVVAPGEQLTRTTRLFAGAKESAVLDRYEASGIPHFGLAIDWGWFRWFEKPIFWLLTTLFHAVGNFGVAIILLTLIVRGIMFPVAQRQFASMAAMRAIQPKMKVLQERYKDDKQKQQQEIMALYKQEGVNPLAGCLPIFLQIPIFFALYKVLTLTIEMRHQPFVLWIKDLSAPDPLHILNLFGMLPFTPPSFLAIGVLALLLGITMYFQFKLNPAQMDPMQQQMFAIMPWVMMFVMAPFAAGLLIYWITSNLLTIAQQKFLYSRHPQLKAQTEKDATDTARAAAREK